MCKALIKLVLLPLQPQLPCLLHKSIVCFTIANWGGGRFGEYMISLCWCSTVSFSLVTQSCLILLWPRGLQHARLPCPSPTHVACLKLCPSSWWCHPAISSSVIPFSSAFNLSQHQGLFKWVSSLHQVAKVLELQHQSLQWIFRTDFL